MRKVIAVVAVIILALLYSSVFVVQQYERGIILRFSKVVRDGEINRSFMNRVFTLKFHLLRM